jgi:UDP-N-acetyl-D-mannosaminuronic acid dehydrogenase
LKKIEKLIETNLESLIKEKHAKIAVIGLGYVGLPTAVKFSEVGFSVLGIDINQKLIDQLNQGVIHTKEVGLDNLIAHVVKNGKFKASAVFSSALRDVNVIITCVQTPIGSNNKPDLTYLKKACESLSLYLTKNQLVIIQSTVPPGTIKSLIIPTLEKTGLKCGTDFWLAYCPERMAPGNGLNDLSTSTRLIGAYNSDSSRYAYELFSAITDGKLQLTNVESAELSKLAENTFRFVNIAFANELALICKELGVDALEVIRLANTHPRVNIHKPGCGAGGPCLSKDTQLLLDCYTSKSVNLGLIHSAAKINEFMPKYVVSLAENALAAKSKTMPFSKVVVLGTAYKGEVDDARDSPARSIVEELVKSGAKTAIFDPYCKESYGQKMAKSIDEAVTDADCIIVATDHKVFSTLDLAQIKKLMHANPVIVDGRRIINAGDAKQLGFTYITTSSA